MYSLLNKRRGFTLIELLVVILVIAILIAVALPSFLGQQDKAHDSAAEQRLAVAYKAAKASTVASENEGDYIQARVEAAINESEPGLLGTGEDQVQVTLADGDDLTLSTPSKSGKDCELTIVNGQGPTSECVEPADEPANEPAGETYTEAITADGVAHLYELNETSGSTVADSVGSLSMNASGTLGASPAFADGGTALGWSGFNSSIQSSNIADTGNAWTYEAWVVMDSGSTGNLMARREMGPPSAPTADLFIGSDGRLNLTTNTNWPGVYSSPITLDGQPKHLVVTYSAGTMRVYINGSEALSESVTYNNPPVVGWFFAPAGNSANRLDKVALYNTALSAERVQAHYTAGS